MGLADNTLIFTLQKNDSERVHYLFGTMHTGNETTIDKYKAVLPYLQRCSHYYGEIDLGEVSSSSKQVFSLPENQPLSQLLGAKFSIKTQKVMRRHFDLDFDVLSNLHPMYVNSILAQKILSPHDGPPLDLLLYHEALKNEMQTGGLETFAFQEALAKNIPLAPQIQMLKQTIKNIGKFRKQVLRLDQLYRDENLRKLYLISKKSMGALRHSLIYERNHNMANKVIQIVSENEFASFISCGAAHFYGQYGMLRKIKTAGIKIKPLYINKW